MQERVSRRATLKILVAAPAALAVLNACGKKDKPDSCTDVSALSDPDKTARTALQYTDASPQPDKRCSGCNLYQTPPEPSQCGTCQVIKGPIHPDGYCTSWVAKI
jgi:hypothetical protein